MKDSGDLADWIELSLVPGLGGQKFRSLLSTFGLPGNVLNATRSQLCRLVPEALASGILERNRGADVEKALQWAAPCRRRIPKATPRNRRSPGLALCRGQREAPFFPGARRGRKPKCDASG